MKSAPTAPTAAEVKANLSAALAALKKNSSEKVRDGMKRYGLPADNAWGVGVGTIQKIAKPFRRQHELAEALWKSGVYEARLLAAFVDDPAAVTAEQMDRWCADFDNWGVVDTVCFKLFDQSALAWKKVGLWCKKKGEFQKRAGVVLIACLAGHDEDATDEQFLKCLPLIEDAAQDERNFVKKGVSWALRMVGRRSPALNVASVKLAAELSESANPAARWVGKDAYRELTSAAVQKRLKTKTSK